MGLHTGERFQFKITSFEKTICGVARNDGTSLFSSLQSLRISSKDILRAMQYGQIEDTTLRVISKLNKLSKIQIDQSQLLNDIRETGYREYFDVRLSALQEKLKIAEEAARGRTGLEQIATLAQLSTDIGKFAGAVGGLSGFWSSIPDTSVAAQTEYLWSKRDTLGKVGGDFGSSAQRIQKGFREIQFWFDRSEELDALKRFKDAIAELDGEYRAILKEVVARRYKYRVSVASIDIELDKSLILRREIKQAIAFNAADIVVLNLLAHIATPEGESSIEQCGRILSPNLLNVDEFNLVDLTIGCLQIRRNVKKRLSCLQAQNQQSKSDTVIMHGGVGAIVWPAIATQCFD